MRSLLRPKDPEHPALTDQTLRAIAGDRTDNPAAIALVVDLAAHYRFLHPHLAFPDVFVADPEAEDGWQGGFDLVLGNPPWDTLSPDRQSSSPPTTLTFVRSDRGTDAIVSRASPRRDDSRTVGAYRVTCRLADFMKLSGRFRHMQTATLARCDFNVYRMFVETALRANKAGGVAVADGSRWTLRGSKGGRTGVSFLSA